MPSKTYKKFVNDLNESQGAVLSVAGYLQKNNRTVILPPHKVTPTEDARYDYQDDADLYVQSPLQVKGSSRTFGSVEEFGFKMVTVDEVYKIKKQKKNPPLGYWIVSADKSGGIFIPWATRKEWDIHCAKDPHQSGRECEYYRCPAKLCEFRNFS